MRDTLASNTDIQLDQLEQFVFLLSPFECFYPLQIDGAKALHYSGDKKCERGGDCTRSYNEDAAMKQLWEWIMLKSETSNVDEATQYWKNVTQERPL